MYCRTKPVLMTIRCQNSRGRRWMMTDEPAIGAALDLIAAGGVANGKNTREVLSRGATAVQISSALMPEGPEVFARVRQESSVGRPAHEPSA
jgi:dihydroorotate dehydrogenase